MYKGEGIRFEIHDYGTKANIADQGQALSPGTEAYASVKMTELLRYNGYSHICREEKNYEQLGYEYSQTTCNSICLDQMIAKYCKCYRAEFIENYNIEQTRNPICGFHEQHIGCQKKFEDRILKGVLNCSCGAACHTVDLDVELSSGNFPPVGRWYELVNKVCAKNPLGCQYLKHEGAQLDKRESLLRDNFIQFRVFFKDLNNHFIEEDLEYGTAQFLSDFGGLIGLWIGMSVITVFEIGEFMLGLVIISYKYFRSKTLHF